MKKRNRKLAGKKPKTPVAVLEKSADTVVDEVLHGAAPSEEAPEAAPTEETPEAAPSEDMHEAAPSEETPEAAPSEETPEATPTEEAPEATDRSPRGARKLPNPLLIVISALSFAVFIAFGVFAFATAPAKTEIGEAAYHHAEALPFCEVMTDLDEIDTDVLGTHAVELRFFGRFTASTTLTVCDRTAPSVTVRELCVAWGTHVVPEDFVTASDMTGLTYEFVEPSRIRVTDEGGNVTVVPYTVTYTDDLKIDDIEAGTSMAQVGAIFEKIGGLAFPQPPMIDTSAVGTYRLVCRYNGMDTLFSMKVVDTTPPTATPRSMDTLIGVPLSADRFVSDIADASDVSVRFESEPSFDNAGEFDVSVIIEDTYGNEGVYTAKLNVHDFPSRLTFEAGSDTAVLTEALSGVDFPRVPDGFDLSALSVGENTVELVGAYSTVPVTIVTEDTKPPIFILNNASVLIGKKPSISDFVTECTDASVFSLFFVTEPDTSVPGDYTVTIAAVDGYGNRAEASANLHIAEDDTPPVIHGVKNITVYEGSSVSYRSGVYAIDEIDGTLVVTVDSSRVDTSVAGIYTVIYTATDSEGNVTKKNATVTVQAISTDVINKYADEVLAKITTASMTPRERARAIYDWCRVNIRYSTSTSHLMGYFNKAAYSGFTRHYGNCYTYYAVASALLTRAGIENIMIQRNSATNPHYWNLVKMDGQWYHFDTCPQPAPHRLEVFLLTDAKVRAFPLSYYYDFDAGKYPATPK